MKNAVPYNRNKITSSEYILNADDSLYHLCIKDEHIADTVIIVGDPNRVKNISDRFSHVESRINSREFCTHTGLYNGVRLSVISSGIGVDNIDIVVNEVDAAINIDPQTRSQKEKTRQINFVRIGTSGTMREEIDLGSFVASKYAFGFDGVPWFYNPEFNQNEIRLMNHFENEMEWNKNAAKPYFVEASSGLYDKVAFDMIAGITATANGFYGPQGRMLRLALANPDQSAQLRNFEWQGIKVTNYEMESAGLYALASMLGHQVLTTCTILANRARGEFAENPDIHINNLIDRVLERLTS